MRKFGTIVLIIGTVFIFNSCKRDWNCVCTFTINGTTTTVYSVIEDETKALAKSDCNSQGMTETESFPCELK